MCGIFIVCSLLGALSIDGRSFEAAESEDGGMFSTSDDGSGGLGGVMCCLGLLRRAHTESMSMVAPEDFGSLDFLDSSL